MKISLIITTKNRAESLNTCLTEVSKSISPHDQVVVIDQSEASQASHNRHTIKIFNSKLNLLYVHSTSSGISIARNIGVMKASGEILAFTDDDCLVDKQWFTSIRNSFRKYPEISGVVGSTLPYGQPFSTDLKCPCTHTVKKVSLINTPQYHVNIGFGNCMAFKKTILNRPGPFKNYLGVGSIGLSAEDADMILHLLTHQKTILNNPRMIVHHNRWLDHQDMQKQVLLYNCGEMACYGYYSIRGHQFATQVILNNFKDTFYNNQLVVKQLIFLKWNKDLGSSFKKVLLVTIYRFRGLLIGYYYSVLDYLTYKT